MLNSHQTEKKQIYIFTPAAHTTPTHSTNNVGRLIPKCNPVKKQHMILFLFFAVLYQFNKIYMYVLR